MALFSEKLSNARLKRSPYDKKFYIGFQTLKKWEHYLINKDFILCFDHKALEFLHNKRRIKNDMYAM